MTAITIPTSHSTYGRVVCRIIRRVGDGDDTGTEPDALPMSGTITFTPLTKWDRTTDYSALAANEAVTAQLNPLTGEMMSPGQPPTIGVDLLVGVYSVSFALDYGTFASFNVEVKASHTAVAPLDLAHEVPYSPPPGVQTTMLVPSGITDGHLLSVSGGALVGVDPATLGGGSEVEQVTLTEDLAYTLPAGVAPNRVHSVVFKQPATPPTGYTVTYGGQPVTVDTAAGASTLVEVWPGGTLVYPGAAGSGSLDTEGVQDVVGAMVTGAGGTYDDEAGTITLPAGGGGMTGPLAMFSALPASPVQWQPYEYRYTEETVWPATIVWASGQPATVGWGVATFVWDGTRWCGEWTTMFGTNTAGEGTSWAPTVTLTTRTLSQLTVTQHFSTFDQNGDPVTVTADWGDGTTPAVVTSPATHTYELNGTYTAWFTPNDGQQSGAPVSAEYVVSSSDVTTPTAGTLEDSDPTNSGFTLTVSGASDAGVGLHAQPFQFSVNDGASWSAWQASPSFVASGLLQGTDYTCVHQVRDAVGNQVTGTPITATTTGASTTFAEAVLSHSPVGYWKLDETSGTTVADSSGNARHGTLMGVAGTEYNLSDGYNGITTGGYAQVPDADAFTIGPNGMTFLAIGRFAASGAANRSIIRKTGSGSNSEWAVNLNWANVEGGGNNTSGGWCNYISTTDNPLPAARWFLMVMYIPKPAPGADPTIYVDSVTPRQTGTGTGTGTANTNKSSPVQIGAGFPGKLRHVAAIQGQLNATQIQGLLDKARAEGLIPA